MRMADRIYVRSAAVNKQMHRQLGGWVSRSGEFIPCQIRDNKIVWRHHAFANIRWRGEDAALVQPKRYIAVRRGHEAALVKPAADGANIAAMFVFAFQRAVSDGFREHVGNILRASSGRYLASCGAILHCMSSGCSLRTRLRIDSAVLQ